MIENFRKIILFKIDACQELNHYRYDYSDDERNLFKNDLIQIEKILSYIEANIGLRDHLDKENLAELYKKGARLYYYFEKNFVKALDYFKRNNKLLVDLHQNTPNLDVAMSLDYMGYCNRHLRMLNDQLENFSQSFSVKSFIYDINSQELAESYYNVGYAHGELNNFDSKEYYLRQSKRIYSKSLDQKINAISFWRKGDYEEEKGDNKSQLESLLRSFQILDQIIEEREKALLVYNLAQCYGRLNKNIEELENYKKSFDIYKKIYKEINHEDYADACYGLAYAYGKNQDYKLQLEYSLKSNEMYTNLFGNINHPSVAKSLFLLAYSYEKMKKIDKSKEYLDLCEKMTIHLENKNRVFNE